MKTLVSVKPHFHKSRTPRSPLLGSQFVERLFYHQMFLLRLVLLCLWWLQCCCSHSEWLCGWTHFDWDWRIYIKLVLTRSYHFAICKLYIFITFIFSWQQKYSQLLTGHNFNVVWGLFLQSTSGGNVTVHTGVQQSRMDGQWWERNRVHTGVQQPRMEERLTTCLITNLSVLYIHCCFQSCSSVDERQ